MVAQAGHGAAADLAWPPPLRWPSGCKGDVGGSLLGEIDPSARASEAGHDTQAIQLDVTDSDAVAILSPTWPFPDFGK